MAFHAPGDKPHPKTTEWNESFPPISREECLCVAIVCKWAGSKGRLYATNERLCFDETGRKKKSSSRLNEPIALSWKNVLFLEDIKGVRLTTHNVKQIQLKGFQGVKNKVMFANLKKLFDPHRLTCQSLHTALRDDNDAMLRALLQSRLAGSLVFQKSEEGELPLQAAIHRGNMEAVRALVSFMEHEGFDINRADVRGNSALHTASLEAARGEAPLHLLLGIEGIDVNAANAEGNTPLHLFCHKATEPTCVKVLEKMADKGVDVNRCNRSGETPVLKALINERVRMIILSFLVERGADVNIHFKGSESPLGYAIHSLGRKDVVQLLVSAGADMELKVAFLSKPGKREGRGEKKKKGEKKVADQEETLLPVELASRLGLNEIATLLIALTGTRAWLRRLGVECLLPYFVQHELSLESLCDMTMLRFETLLTTLEQRWEELCKPSTVAEGEAERRGDLFPRELLSREWVSLRSRKDLRREVLEDSQSLSRAESRKLQRSLRAAIKGARQDSLRYRMEQVKTPEQREKLEKEKARLLDTDWVIDYYKLELCCKVAEGASGKVYQGLMDGEEVAVKVLQDKDDMDKELEGEDLIEELLAECRTLNRVSGPQIVGFKGVCVEPAVCIVMEYCARGSLTDVLRNPTFSLGWRQLLLFFKQVALGLHTLHSACPSILHRDMKSGNVLVTENYHLRLADFGMARAQVKHNIDTLAKMRGTVAFIAPELILGEGPTVKSDIYALGIILWELVNKCCTGTYCAPYVGMGFTLDFQVLLAVSEKGVRPELPPCPAEVKALIEKLWHGEKETRPSLKKIMKSVKALGVQYGAESEAWDEFLPVG